MVKVCVAVVASYRRYRSTWFVRVLNLHFSIFKALKVLNLATRSLKVLNFIFVKSSLNIKIIVVFIILNCLWILFFYTSIMSVSL